MMGFVVAVLVGVLCIALGISNMKGNLSSLHSYHRHRVREEDRIPYGRKIGLGTLLIGVGVIGFGLLSIVALCTERQVFYTAASVFLTVGLVVGLVLSVYAMIKYNKGIF